MSTTAAEPAKPAIEILGVSFTELPDEKGVLQPRTHIVYRDEAGLIGTVTIPKKDPSDSDIRLAILEQRKAIEARKPHFVRL